MAVNVNYPVAGISNDLTGSVSSSQIVPALTLAPQFLKNLVAYKYGSEIYCNKTISDFVDFSIFTNQYYVDSNRPDDTGNGLTWATAKKTIRAAIDLANASGIASKIAVRGGTYARVNGFSPSGVDITLSVPMYIYAVYGSVKTGPFDRLTFTKTSGQTYVYQTARTVVNSAYNPLIDGVYKGVASIALCDAEAGTFYTDGTTFYCHPHNSAVASSSNCMPILNSRNAAFVGDKDLVISGFDFIGGSSGCLLSNGGTTSKTVVENCSFRFALGGTYAAQTAVDGVVILDCAIFAAFNSKASYNSKDGFNVHVGGDNSKPFTFMYKCSGISNGTLSTSQSNNGLTIHDGCQAVDIGGEWAFNVGTGSGHVNDETVIWSFGSVAGYSDGDIVNGGSINWGAFGVWSGAATMYLDSCTDVGSAIGVYAGSGASVFIRNHKGTGSIVGNVTLY